MAHLRRICELYGTDTRCWPSVLWGDGKGNEMENTTIAKAKDPVCGMNIQTNDATGRTEHSGQTYYFCGSRCKEKFDKHPEQYLVASA